MTITDSYSRAVATHAEALKVDLIARVRYDGDWFCEICTPRGGWARV